MPATAHTPRRQTRHGIGALALWLILHLTLPAQATASPRFAHLEGQVTAQAGGQPVAGAQVTLPDLGLSAVTDADGRFFWHDIPLPSASLAVTVTVMAAGFAPWTIANVRLLADDTLILAAQLSDTATRIAMPTEPLPHPDPPALSVPLLSRQMHLPLPATIRVRVTNYPYCDLSRPYTVQTVDFRTYLRHVLPNEWPAGWHPEALRAGAMAAKTYAWFWIARGGKWPDADVYDSTCDQYYNPAVAYASTDAAIDATWHWRLTRDGALIHTSYRTYHWMCAAAGLTGNCMGIVDSRAMAQQGHAWPDILHAFYADAVLTPMAVGQRRFFPLAHFSGT